MFSKSATLVISSGRPLTGPQRAGPTKPAVLVLTPSIDFERKLVSSTYTPGDRYSGIRLPPFEELHGAFILHRSMRTTNDISTYGKAGSTNNSDFCPPVVTTRSLPKGSFVSSSLSGWSTC